MRLKKMTAVALAAALAAGSFGGTTAFAADTTTTNDITLSTTVQNNTVKYVLSIPSGTKTIESAKDTFSNVGTLQVKHLDSEADVKFDNTKKVSVAVTYSGNLTNTDNTITSNNKLAYKLVKGTKDSNTDIASGTTYDFSADDIDKATGSVAIGAVVTGDPTQVENGTYTDKVTFTASVEKAKTTKTVTFNTATDGKTINKDGVTCRDSFDNYNNLVGWGSEFSVSSGQFTKIEVTAQDVSMVGKNQTTYEKIEGWSAATWTGKSSTVPFGVIMGNENPVTIVFTIEE
jgi:hypothetical protein